MIHTILPICAPSIMDIGPFASLNIGIPTTFTLPTDAKHMLVNRLSKDIVAAIQDIKACLTINSDNVQNNLLTYEQFIAFIDLYCSTEAVSQAIADISTGSIPYPSTTNTVSTGSAEGRRALEALRLGYGFSGSISYSLPLDGFDSFLSGLYKPSQLPIFGAHPCVIAVCLSDWISLILDNLLKDHNNEDVKATHSFEYITSIVSEFSKVSVVISTGLQYRLEGLIAAGKTVGSGQEEHATEEHEEDGDVFLALKLFSKALRGQQKKIKHVSEEDDEEEDEEEEEEDDDDDVEEQKDVGTPLPWLPSLLSAQLLTDQ